MKEWWEQANVEKVEEWRMKGKGEVQSLGVEGAFISKISWQLVSKFFCVWPYHRCLGLTRMMN